MIFKTWIVIRVMAVSLGIATFLGLVACQSKTLCQEYCDSKSFVASYESECRCNCSTPKPKRVIYFNRTQGLGEFEEI